LRQNSDSETGEENDIESSILDQAPLEFKVELECMAKAAGAGSKLWSKFHRS